MKTTFLALALVLSTSAFADMAFKRDSRPVDGDMKLLTIVNEDAAHSASVKLISAYVNRFNGQDVKQTLVDERGMDCKVKRSAGKLQSVVCTVGRRPVDGPMVQISVKRDSRFLLGFNVTKKTVIVSRMTGQQHVKIEELANNLREQGILLSF